MNTILKHWNMEWLKYLPIYVRTYVYGILKYKNCHFWEAFRDKCCDLHRGTFIKTSVNRL